MQPWFLWWILAAVLVGIELTSGTFYLLVYGIAAAAAGLAAWLGASTGVQLIVASLIAAAGTWALRRWRRGPTESPQAMEIGQGVKLETWADGRGQVQYRGALWDAEAASSNVDATRPLFIRAVNGNVLIVGN